jgi:uncharacterized tellurite resistance protein B-like protein
MDEQEIAIVKGLVPIAWADGVFAEREGEMLEALLEAYGASEGEKAALRAYAAEKKTLDDIDVQELSAGDRRVLLHHAVLITWADGDASPDEARVLDALSARLRIPADEAAAVVAAATDRARRSLHLIAAPEANRAP